MFGRKTVGLLLVSLLMLLSFPALANSGRVITMSGDVKVNGQPMSKRYRVKSGDVITTGSRGRVNIIMADKSVLDLQPNTKFKLERFRFNRKAPKKSRSVMNLLRGSFRFISGLVGRTNHANATIKLGTATFGIRGSFATFGFDSTTKDVTVNVSLGQMTVKYADGSTMTVNKGQTGRSKSNGEGKRVAQTSPKNKAMKAAEDILKLKSPPAKADVEAILQGLTDAEKAMVVAVLIANPTQLKATTTELTAAIKTIVAVEPNTAPLVAAIVTMVAEDGTTASTIVDAIKEVPGVDIDAIDAAVIETNAFLDDPIATGDTDNTVVVDDVTIGTTSASSGGASPSTPLP